MSTQQTYLAAQNATAHHASKGVLDVKQATRVLLGPGNANISPEQLDAAIELIVAQHLGQTEQISAAVLQMAVTAGVSARQLADLGRPDLTRASINAYLESCNICWAQLEDQTLAWQTHPGTQALYDSRVVAFTTETELHRRIWAGMAPMEAVPWAINHNVPIYNLQNIALGAIHSREGEHRFQDVYVEENWSAQYLGWIAHCLAVPIPPGGFERGAAQFPTASPTAVDAPDSAPTRAPTS